VAVNTLKAANTHLLVWAISVGVNLTLQTRAEDVRVTRSQALGGAGNLAQQRCLCPKN
jgi:hypothetical protein